MVPVYCLADQPSNHRVGLDRNTERLAYLVRFFPRPYLNIPGNLNILYHIYQCK
jgi:hypothetical protein